MLYDFKNLATDLKDATITYTGETITIMFRNRDRLSHELKKVLSHTARMPVHFIFQSKQGFKQEWWFHGSHHNPFGGPALQTITDTDYLEHYYDKQGWHGRDDGPALIEHQYGQKYREDWINTAGKKHRIGGPAIIAIEYGLPTISSKTHFNDRVMQWYKSDKPFNNGLWTRSTDATGTETYETISTGLMRTLLVAERTIYWDDENNKLHRTEGPAFIRFTGFKEVEKVGKEPVWRWEDWHGEWYIHGTNIPYGDILKWSKKNQISMWNEPCYNRSAFRTDDGEVLFITDFTGAIK